MTIPGRTIRALESLGIEGFSRLLQRAQIERSARFDRRRSRRHRRRDERWRGGVGNHLHDEGENDPLLLVLANKEGRGVVSAEGRDDLGEVRSEVGHFVERGGRSRVTVDGGEDEAALLEVEDLARSFVETLQMYVFGQNDFFPNWESGHFGGSGEPDPRPAGAWASGGKIVYEMETHVEDC